MAQKGTHNMTTHGDGNPSSSGEGEHEDPPAIHQTSLWLQLPMELQQMVWSFLEPRDLFLQSLICRAWRAYCIGDQVCWLPPNTPARQDITPCCGGCCVFPPPPLLSPAALPSPSVPKKPPRGRANPGRLCTTVCLVGRVKGRRHGETPSSSTCVSGAISALPSLP